MNTYPCHINHLVTVANCPLPENARKLTLDDILQACAEQFEVTPQAIMSKSRKDEIVKARHAFCYLATQFTSATLASIGEKIGKDHTTVINARNNVAKCFTCHDNWSTEMSLNIWQLKLKLAA